MNISDKLRDCASRSNRPDLIMSEYYFPESYIDDYTCDLQHLFRLIADEIDAEINNLSTETSH